MLASLVLRHLLFDELAPSPLWEEGPRKIRQIKLEGALGYCYIRSGNEAKGLPLLEQAVEQGSRSLWGIWLSESYAQTGRLAEAQALANHTLDLARRQKERGWEVQVLCLLGDLALHCDSLSLEAVETHYQQALMLASELGMRPLQAHCHRGLGNLYRQTGQAEQARGALSTAVEMYQDMGMTFWQPETEAALAQVSI